MRLRTPSHDEPTASSAGPSTGTASDSERAGASGLARHLLVGIGMLALSYVVARALDSSDEPPVPGAEIRERAVAAAPTDVTRPIAERWERTDDVAAAAVADREGDVEASSDESTVDDADVLEETRADYTADERPDEEIAERTESDVQSEPAEPGEMSVDEEIAEHLVDEEIDADADDTDEE